MSDGMKWMIWGGVMSLLVWTGVFLLIDHDIRAKCEIAASAATCQEALR